MNRPVSIGYLIARLHRCAGRYLDRELGCYGLGFGTFPFLVTLYIEDGLSQSRLSAEVDTDKSNTTRAVRKLVSLGYARKERDRTDSRAFAVYLTPKARAIKHRIFEILAAWNDITTRGMTRQTTDQTRELLQQMVANTGEYFNETSETKQ